MDQDQLQDQEEVWGVEPAELWPCQIDPGPSKDSVQDLKWQAVRCQSNKWQAVRCQDKSKTQGDVAM